MIVTIAACVTLLLWVMSGSASTENSLAEIAAGKRDTPIKAHDHSLYFRAHLSSNYHRSRQYSSDPGRSNNYSYRLHQRYFSLHAYRTGWRYPGAFPYHRQAY